MTRTFPDEACAITCTFKVYLLLKLQFKKSDEKGFVMTLLPLSVVVYFL